MICKSPDMIFISKRAINFIRPFQYNLTKKEFRDAIKLRYDWEITDTPLIWACGGQISVDHAMACGRGGFIVHAAP